MPGSSSEHTKDEENILRRETGKRLIYKVEKMMDVHIEKNPNPAAEKQTNNLSILKFDPRDFILKS